MHSAQLRIVFHGAIILLLGLLCGLPYGQAITAGWGEDAVRGWRNAHLGIAIGGVWMLAVAGFVERLDFGARLGALVVPAILASGYGFAAALGLGAATGNRGLEPVGSALNVIVFLGNAIGSVGALAATVFLIVGSARALRTPPRRS
jgi:hypothetical protein